MFWQHRTRSLDPSLKRRWASDTEKSFGPWGRLLVEDGRFRGLVQYGPASRFPRARSLPAGPPSRDAAVITCAYLEGDDLAGTSERLLLEALADLKSRGVAAVEAFALTFSDDVAQSDRFTAHHTLFDRDMLDRFGFRPLRSAGQVTLMRLALGGLQPAETSSLVARLTQPLRAWPVSLPSPVALRSGT